MLNLLFLLSPFLYSSTHAETLHPWEVCTLSFHAAKEIPNPYAQISSEAKVDLLTVSFEGVSGEATGKQLTLTGFWDGGKEWKVNFTSPYSGNWKYKSLSKDKGMNGKSGFVEVIPWTESQKQANPTRHGFVRVSTKGDNAGHYFEYSDGCPFLWIGDTWWNWNKKEIKSETFKQLVDDRADKGFNVGQLFVPGNGWNKRNSLLDTTYTILDIDHVKKIEEMIRYANSKGITVWIHGWWGRRDLDKQVGADNIRRWWRYLVHRFGAYNVVWVLAGEYNLFNYGNLGLDFWNDLGKMIKQEDPYNRITSVHSTPPFWEGGKDAPQWSTATVLHNEPWLDYNQCQVGHGKFANEMIPRCVSDAYSTLPAKPIVVTEPWYEFSKGEPDAGEIRFGAWSAILSGAAGHTYGGGKIWLADVPESPQHGNSEPIAQGGTTLDYEGAVSFKYLTSFMKDIHWWEMKPHPELISEYPQGFCLATPGKEYLIYLRYGGVAKIFLEEKEQNSKFRYFWFDPATGKRTDPLMTNASEAVEFKCPTGHPSSVAENKDWVLFIQKVN